MIIATFNINGIKARLPRLLEYLETTSVDVVCLQEIKSQDETFPRLEFEDRGWVLETHGQKSFNGVALLSRHPIKDIERGLPGMTTGPDGGPEQSRYIEGTIKGIRIASLYLPNGNPQPGVKFSYKLDWMDHLVRRAATLLKGEQPIVLAGDYNIIPDDMDCYDPAAWVDDALTQPESRARFRALANLGYYDAIRQLHPVGPKYSYWDYQRGAWQKDHGIRIDHLMLSPQAADLLEDADIDRIPRGKEKASDHTPVWIKLRDIEA